MYMLAEENAELQRYIKRSSDHLIDHIEIFLREMMENYGKMMEENVLLRKRVYDLEFNELARKTCEEIIDMPPPCPTSVPIIPPLSSSPPPPLSPKLLTTPLPFNHSPSPGPSAALPVRGIFKSSSKKAKVLVTPNQGIGPH